MSTITLENVGPIESLSIPIPDGGGLIVLKGKNGTGKTHALGAVESLYSKDARKSLRNSDGTPAGSIEGLGVKVRLGRSNTARGELVCESLDGRIDPSKLVDPGIKDPIAADNKRLATVVRLAGVALDQSHWNTAVGAETAAEIDLPELIDADPIVTAERIRRKVHELALTAERKSERATAEAKSLRESVADVDTESECDTEALDKAFEIATEKLAAAKQQRMQGLEHEAHYKEVKTLLAQHEAGAIDAEAAEKTAFDLKNKLTEKEVELGRLREQVQALKAEINQLEVEKRAADEKAELAQQQRLQIEKWRQIVNADRMAIVTEDEIAELEAAKKAAHEAIVQGEIIARAKQTVAKAVELSKESLALQKRSKQLRNLARSTDSVLEEALRDAGFDQIKVSHSRLCVESDRGLEPFAELSHGERWRLALDLAAAGLPKGSVLPVCQEAYEALDPDNRLFIHKLAKERGLGKKPKLAELCELFLRYRRENHEIRD